MHEKINLKCFRFFWKIWRKLQLNRFFLILPSWKDSDCTIRTVFCHAFEGGLEKAKSDKVMVVLFESCHAFLGGLKKVAINRIFFIPFPKWEWLYHSSVVFCHAFPRSLEKVVINGTFLILLSRKESNHTFKSIFCHAYLKGLEEITINRTFPEREWSYHSSRFFVYVRSLEKATINKIFQIV